MYSSSFPKYSMFTSPHRVSHLTFILYSPDLLYKVTYIFWALTCLVALPTHTALISNFCTSSQNFDTHFLHFHLTMDSLCFSMWLAIYTSTTDFHRLVHAHAGRTKKSSNYICNYYFLLFNSSNILLNSSLLISILLSFFTIRGTSNTPNLLLPGCNI